MKNLFTVLFVSLAFIIAGCGSEKETHSHGEDGDHTHETPAQPSMTDDSDAVRIGGGDHSSEGDSTHAHDDEEDHSHDEEEHSHDDSTHSHGDEEHSH
ncbi:MAG: hypothetical protein JJ953_11970 [Gracilimonas sp.]|uniref:hypothetical protein n=1 Tax=Gracilimonas TaxID=649462 RepID=UPI001B24AE2D|nr:hypothetical protein [Gracilimonas sp.]MBO6586815.1 hypothetical protein [Gracilimonas sp.]MBO6614697.1 hypothetical protein [Gracilimonas sp.]